MSTNRVKGACLVAIAACAGVVAAISLTAAAASTSDRAAQVGLHVEGRTDEGLTYGKILPGDGTVPADVMLDLVAAGGDSGKAGYVRESDLLSGLSEPTSPDEAVAMAAQSRRPRTVPLYASDGRTVIDTFTINAPPTEDYVPRAKPGTEVE